MDEVLERLISQEKEIAFVGTTVVETEQLIKDLETLDARAQVKITSHILRLSKTIYRL